MKQSKRNCLLLNLHEKKLTRASYCMSIMQEPETTVLFESGSPDSDVFFILLQYAASSEDITVLFDTGTGNKQRLINVSRMASDFGQTKSTALMRLHACIPWL